MRSILKNKEAIKSIVEPIESSTKVFNALKLSTSFVQEFDEDGIYVGNSDEDNTMLVYYKINIADVFDEYSIVTDKIGIWDTNQYVKIFKKYLKLYDTDDHIHIDFQNNKYVIKSGNEEDVFHTASPKQIRQGSRGVDISSLTKECGFVLSGSDLIRILSNIDVYSEQTTVSFIGDKDEGNILVKIHTPDIPNQNSGSSVISGVDIKKDFSINFGKTKIKSVLETNDSFDITLYSMKGSPIAMHFYYDKGGYDMNYYVSPNRARK